MSITPNKRPQLTRGEGIAYLTRANIKLKENPVVILGIRGYYANSFGKPRVNDIGYDDDAFFVITPTVFRAFNGNVDPSVRRSRIATLIAGAYKFVKWMHRGKYRGFQITRDKVTRDGLRGIDEGRHGINFHKHQRTKTDSEGCQTIPESQYAEFVKLVDSELDKYSLQEGLYLLIDKA